MKWLLIAGGIIVVGCMYLFAYSLCFVAKRADERAEAMHRARHMEEDNG